MLSDVEKRRTYDQFGTADFGAGASASPPPGGGAPGGGPGGWGFHSTIDAEEMFRRIFGDIKFGGGGPGGGRPFEDMDFDEFAGSNFGFNRQTEVYDIYS